MSDRRARSARCSFAPLRTSQQDPVLPVVSRCCIFACTHARRAPVRGTGGARTAAAQHELHCERRPAPAAVHRQIPHALPVGRTLMLIPVPCCPRKALSRVTTYVYRQTLGGPRAARAREIRGTRERGGRGPRPRGRGAPTGPRDAAQSQTSETDSHTKAVNSSRTAVLTSCGLRGGSRIDRRTIKIKDRTPRPRPPHAVSHIAKH